MNRTPKDCTTWLAWPGALSPSIVALLKSLGSDWYDMWFKSELPKVIVGPQRAGNLIYEIARLLNCVASAAIEYCTKFRCAECGALYATFTPTVNVCSKCMGLQVYGYDLDYKFSYPIPPEAQVLFVTDQFNKQEMEEIIKAARIQGVVNNFPQILCLVSDCHEVNFRTEGFYTVAADPWKVVSLHQEPL